MTRLLKQYRVHKGKITELLPGWDTTNPWTPMSSSVWRFELAKSAVVIAMQTVYGKHQQHLQHLELLQSPTNVKVTAAFKVGQLILPAATMRLESKAGKNTLSVGLDVHMAPHFGKFMDAEGVINKNCWVVPFWLVDDKSDTPNMQLRHEHCDIHGKKVHVPMLVNNKALKAGDSVGWMKKSAADEQGDQSGSADGKPGKAAKKAKSR